MKKTVLFVFSFLLILAAGCAKENDYRISIYVPKTFTPGKTTPLQFSVADQTGKPIKGAKVLAKLNMKNMDHGTISLNTEETEPGKYLAVASLPMDGEWVADITVSKNGQKTEAEKSFAVAVRTNETAHKVSKDVLLPDFSLVDQEGNPITKQDLLGKRVAMTFTYVNCDDPNACPVLLGNLSKLQQEIKARGTDTSNLLLLSVSIDPENDQPAVLKEHATKMNFDLSYLKMLTGEMIEIKKLTEPLGEQFVKNGSEVVHDNKTFIFDESGHLTHEFTGSYVDQEELYLVLTGGK